MVDSVCTNVDSVCTRPSPDFSPWLRDKIWKGPGDEASCDHEVGMAVWS